MKLTARPLTTALWPAFVDLFADSPVCGRCWCIYGFETVARHTPPRPIMRYDLKKKDPGWTSDRNPT